MNMEFGGGWIKGRAFSWLFNVFIEKAIQTMKKRTKGKIQWWAEKMYLISRWYCKVDWFGRGNEQDVTCIVWLLDNGNWKWTRQKLSLIQLNGKKRDHRWYTN